MRACAADRSRHAPGWLRLAGALVCLIVIAPAPVLGAAKVRTTQTPATAGIPLPPPRPADAAQPIKPDHEAQAATSEAPTPPPRPADIAEPAQAAAASAKPELVAEESACQERLLKLGLRFEPVPAIVNGQCGAPHPLRVSHLPDGLEVSPPATLNRLPPLL